MRIVQLVLDSASQYERKCQRADFATLSSRYDVSVATQDTFDAAGADVVHVYASGELPARLFRRFPVPYVASTDVAQSRWTFGKAAAPVVIFSPLPAPEEGRVRLLPEAVEEQYWEAQSRTQGGRGERKTVGSYRRSSTHWMVEQTVARLHRFRDDIDWVTVDETPTPAVLAGVDLWVDPAVEEDDFDGFAAEALVIGTTVVASRTPISQARLEQGRCGTLVPRSDPNEMTHAILTALFKPEVAESKNTAARQTASKYRGRHRLRVLSQIYETLTP